MVLALGPNIEEKSQEELWEVIQAFCKGFLLMPDLPSDRTMSFCRGLLILLERYVDQEGTNLAS